MNIARIDLNLLVYFDVLMREQNVTRAAEQLGITQPAMSNALKRLRELFNDPLLIRSSVGMKPTERALELQPLICKILSETQQILGPKQLFKPLTSTRGFRIMASDYAEATLFPALIKNIRSEAPLVTLDILTPSDINYHDLEQGRVDMAINRFDDIPDSFHQKTVWTDTFSCLMSKKNPLVNEFNLKNYLKAHHIWVSKTGLGVSVGINPDKSAKLGWVDQALERIGKRRKISLFTRHYQMPGLLAQNNDLVATLPTRIARMQAQSAGLVLKPAPFFIPELELKMAWSPMMHHNPAHDWLRQLITYTAETLNAQEPSQTT